MTAAKKVLGATALAVVMCGTLVAPASGQPRPNPLFSGGGTDTLVNSGVCSAGSSWQLAGRSRFLRVVVEARVVTDVRRQRWVLSLAHNQTTIVRIMRRPTGRGLVRVRGRVRNEPGPDTFTMTARNRITGEICQGTLTF